MPETLSEWVSWLSGNFASFILPFLLVISILVFVHEWGHYIVARMCGVKVEVFSIGFGKKLFGWTDKAGTHWQVALFPLGGYVKMFGDTDPASGGHTDQVASDSGTVRAMTAEERAQAFFSKPVAQRAAIVFAGPAINFIFAIILLFGIYTTVGKPITPAVATAVIAGSAGEAAGIQPLDRITAIDGKPVFKFSDIQRSVAISLEKPVSITIDRGGQVIEIPSVSPTLDTVTDRFGFTHSRGLLGLIGPGSGIAVESIRAVNGSAENIEQALKDNMGQVVTLSMPHVGEDEMQNLRVRLDPALNADFINGTGEQAKRLTLFKTQLNERVQFAPLDAFVEAMRETWFVTKGTLHALGQMIIGTRSAQELGGIIRIGAVTGDAAQAGIIALITLGALLSINLGLINLFPIPMLDGGHLMFYAFEAVRGKPISERVQDVALRMGLYLLIGLMLFANINDVVQLSK